MPIYILYSGSPCNSYVHTHTGFLDQSKQLLLTLAPGGTRHCDVGQNDSSETQRAEQSSSNGDTLKKNSEHPSGTIRIPTTMSRTTTSQENNPATSTTVPATVDHPSHRSTAPLTQGFSECQQQSSMSVPAEPPSSSTSPMTTVGPCPECPGTSSEDETSGDSDALALPSLKRSRETSETVLRPTASKKARIETPVSMMMMKKKKATKRFSSILKNMMNASSLKSMDQERDALRQSLGGGAFPKVATI